MRTLSECVVEIVHGYQEDTFLTGLFSMRKLNDLDFIRDSMRASELNDELRYLLWREA